ncbi:hypothetical protein JCM11491_001583 [Sporobolomyces phaffii]
MDQSTSRASPSRLDKPVLFVVGLPHEVQDEEIVGVLSECLRLRLNLDRRGNAPLKGAIEFESLHNAEKAYATAKDQVFPQHAASLSLSLSPTPGDDPLPLAQPRLIKSLPRHFTAGKVFDLCREFGPIHSATLQLAPAFPPGSGPPKFKGQALVTFYDEDDANDMTQGLQYLEVEGLNIIVALWDPKRAERGRRSDVSRRSRHSDASSATAAVTSPVPNKAERTSKWAHSTALAGGNYPSDLGATAPEFVSPAMSRNVSGASQWSNTTAETSYRDESSPRASRWHADSATTPSSIDPCNLFVKSLDPSLSSEYLRDLFSPYGDIVSARVMVDSASLRSKEFGFVSFKRAEQADAARRAMDGKLVGTRHITVRPHEPKRLREARTSSEGPGDLGVPVAPREKEERGGRQTMEGVATGFAQLSTAENRPVSHTSALPAESSSSLASSTRSTPTLLLSEHERLLSAVARIDSQRANEIVKLIESLPRKEQVMCLFNPEVLEQKVHDAALVLEAMHEGDAEPSASASSPTHPAADATEIPPECSDRLAGDTTSPGVPSSIHLLAKLPSAEIVPLLAASTPLLGLSTPSFDELDATNDFMDEIQGLPVGQVKQKLGEKLFKVVKRTGVKRSPKITIDLLDTEDLRSLATLLHYPEIIKEKALLLST